MFAQHRPLAALLLGALACLSQSAAAAPAGNGVVECTTTQKHNPDLAGKSDRILCFEGYVSNFNSKAAQTIRGKPRYAAVPHWVTHHIARAASAPESNERPDSWFTVPDLNQQGIAPTDDSYTFSQKFRKRHANWYERGHLAQKYLVERVSAPAAWFTHNVANAVPQRGQFNKGTWLTLECYTGAWAHKYGEVWVITGPIFKKGRIAWLRSDNKRKAIPVAIPSALFKIVLKKDSDGKWDALSFVMPQTSRTYKKGPFDPAVWFKSISEIERMSGGAFLPALGDGAQPLKRNEPSKLWPVSQADFDAGCKSQKANVL
jgi:endonuclease G, mitochondrial